MEMSDLFSQLTQWADLLVDFLNRLISAIEAFVQQENTPNVK
jgi:hypothetical protein